MLRHVVAITGLCGSGKTTLSTKLAYKINADVINMDLVMRDFIQNPENAEIQNSLAKLCCLDSWSYKEYAKVAHRKLTGILSILKPFVEDIIQKTIDDNKEKSLVIEISAFVEYQIDPMMFTDIICLNASNTTRRSRLLARGWEFEKIDCINNFQISMTNSLLPSNHFHVYDSLEDDIDYLVNKLNPVETVPVLVKPAKSRKLKVGLFIGSFNPFHVGHLDVIKSAEKIFDKVVIVRLQNPNKPDMVETFPDMISGGYEAYNSRLTTVQFIKNYVNSYGVDLTLVRGIRNASDFEYENVQTSWIKEELPNLEVVYFNSKHEYSHISSSAIKNLMNMNNDLYKKYIVE